MRPQTIDEVVGQEHLLGVDKPLGKALRGGRPYSMILWGPPGCGKTTLARLAAAHGQAALVSLSAVLAGVADLRREVAAAEQRRAERSSSSTRSIASTRPSRTPCCRMWSPGC